MRIIVWTVSVAVTKLPLLFLGIDSQEQHTRRNNRRANDSKHHLCLPASLYQRLSSRVLRDSLDIVGKAAD